MTNRTASCSCGQLRVMTTGEPVRVGVCHCLACQKRSGSAFAAQARFTPAQVRFEGASKMWTRIGDEGGHGHFRFCPECGSTVWYTIDAEPELIAVALGAFADPDFPAPLRASYDNRRHRWVTLAGVEALV